MGLARGTWGRSGRLRRRDNGICKQRLRDGVRQEHLNFLRAAAVGDRRDRSHFLGDAAGQEHRRSRDIAMKRERSTRTSHYELGAKSSSHQRLLEFGLPHTHRDHDRRFSLRWASQGESSRVVAFTPNTRLGKNEIGMLPGPEFKVCTIYIEPEGHRVSCDSLPID